LDALAYEVKAPQCRFLLLAEWAAHFDYGVNKEGIATYVLAH